MQASSRLSDRAAHARDERVVHWDTDRVQDHPVLTGRIDMVLLAMPVVEPADLAVGLFHRPMRPHHHIAVRRRRCDDGDQGHQNRERCQVFHGSPIMRTAKAGSVLFHTADWLLLCGPALPDLFCRRSRTRQTMQMPGPPQNEQIHGHSLSRPPAPAIRGLPAKLSENCWRQVRPDGPHWLGSL